MNQVVNVKKCFDLFDEQYCPKIIGELNGQQIKVVKLDGDKVPWHTHQNEDEMFFVIEGQLTIRLRDASFQLNPGEFQIVPRGVEHRITAHGPVKLMLFEPASLSHTGDVQSEITQTELQRLVRTQS